VGERLGAGGAQALEDLDVHTAGEDLPLSPDHQRPQLGALGLVERRHQLLPHALPE